MEVKAHAEQMGDSMGLINATGTKAPDVEFLERYHIWLASGDHFGDPSWICPSVCADAPVDIVGHDAQRSWLCTLVPAVEWIHGSSFMLGRSSNSSLSISTAGKAIWAYRGGCDMRFVVSIRTNMSRPNNLSYFHGHVCALSGAIIELARPADTL
jgi:hypothetical protein